MEIASGLKVKNGLGLIEKERTFTTEKSFENYSIPRFPDFGDIVTEIQNIPVRKECPTQNASGKLF